MNSLLTMNWIFPEWLSVLLRDIFVGSMKKSKPENSNVYLEDAITSAHNAIEVLAASAESAVHDLVNR